MRRIKGIKQPFERVLSPLSAVADQQRHSHNREELYAADGDHQCDHSRKKREQRRYRAEQKLRGPPLYAERAHIQQPHTDGQQDARNAIIDIQRRKTTQPHGESECTDEGPGAQDRPALAPGDRKFFQPFERINERTGEGKGDEDIAIRLFHHEGHGCACQNAQRTDERKVPRLVARIVAPLSEQKGKQRHRDAPDNAESDLSRKQDPPDMVDQHRNTGDDLELIAAEKADINAAFLCHILIGCSPCSGLPNRPWRR